MREFEKVPQHQKDQEEIRKQLEGLNQRGMPRFEDFFKAEAEGKHPLEYLREKGEKDDPKNNVTEEENLYERELRGRLMGEKLTNEQFEHLT